jgi:signal transduction histidine kinase
MSRLLRDLGAPLTYTRILYLLLAFPIGVVEFSFLVTGISFGFGTVITLIGIPILIGMVFAWRWLAGGERWLIERLLGVRIAPPYREPAPGAGGWERLRAYLVDPATWKDLVFLGLRMPIGILSFGLALAALSVGLGGLFAPAYAWLPGDWTDDVGSLSGYPAAVLAVPAGALILLAGIPALNELGRLNASFGVQLLGSSDDPQLTAEVTDLRDARARVIAAADAERRRLERDLHDGAQQRLVALALTLRMAEQRAEKGDPAAAELVRQAGEEAGHALSELRDLARGIHPAILTNRGLAAALGDLAGRATVPVEIVEAPAERLPDAVEAAAYFVVSECLANVGKHAQASSASVSVRAGPPGGGRDEHVGAVLHGDHAHGAVGGDVVEGVLVVEVADDGVGGANLDGSGIQGLQDRVGAAGGRLTVTSPVGAGTRIRAEIPLSPPAAEDGLASPSRRWVPRVRTDDEASTVNARRRRLLGLRLAVAGVVAGVLVLIWALTGAPGSLWPIWPIWPLLAIALVTGLDAWFVFAFGPLRHADLPADARDRTTAALKVVDDRRERATAGALAIVDLFLIGIWLAAGGGYFWPVWPLLGTAAAVAVKALRRRWRVPR